MRLSVLGFWVLRFGILGLESEGLGGGGVEGLDHLEVHGKLYVPKPQKYVE